MAEQLETLRTVALVALVVVAALIDVRSRRVPNALTLPAIGAGLLLAALGGSLTYFITTLGTAALVFAAGLLLYSTGVLGGGDGKLLTAVAALGGADYFAEFLVWTSIAGVAGSLIVLAAKRALLPLMSRVTRSSLQFLRYGFSPEPLVPDGGHRIPYAVIIAAGAVAALVSLRLGLEFFR